MNGKGLTRKEIALIKAMQARGKRAGFTAQKILSYFSRPERTINVARLYEIRDGTRGLEIKSASEEELHRFLTRFTIEGRVRSDMEAPRRYTRYPHILVSIRGVSACCLVLLMKMTNASHFAKD
jgi:hypothetical protein